MAEPHLCPPPHGYHNGCYDCANQYLSTSVQQARQAVYAEHLSDDEAAHRIKVLLEALDEIRVRLRQILETHGDLILARWSKKSKDKRAALLTSTNLIAPWASAPDCGPHALDRWIRSHGKVWHGAKWLAVKPFAEDRMKLLSLLHLREAYPPSDWALIDTRESMAGFGEVSELSSNPKCVIMFGERYGDLVDWNDAMTHSWAYAGFPRAFATIKNQVEMLLFLGDMAHSIVQDAPSTGAHKWRSLIASGMRGSGCEALWSSYTSPAFVPPTLCGFNPRSLQEKAEVRLNVCLE